MSLTQRLQRTSGHKSLMTNPGDLMTCMGCERSWNVGLEKFTKAQSVEEEQEEEDEELLLFLVFCSFSSFLVSFRSGAGTHARHIWRQ